MTEKKDGAEDTLDAESTIRMHYLRDKIRDGYYVNQHIPLSVSPDEISRAEISHASPESTQQLMVWMRYLILELWQTGLLDDNMDEIIKKFDLKEHHKLCEILEQDDDVKDFVQRMRQRFSTHASFTSEKAVEEIESLGFRKLWKYVLLIILFKDAIRTVCYKPCDINLEELNTGKYIVPPDEIITETKRQKLKLFYDKMSFDIELEKYDKARIMRDCAICLNIMRDDLMIATKLHRCYGTEETLILYVNAIYNMKYMILELHEFIKHCDELKIPSSLGFMTRKKKYKEIRGQYSAHRDKDERITSIMQLFEDPDRWSNVVQDVEEATILSKKLFPNMKINSKLRLPTKSQIVEIKQEIEDVRLACHKQYDGKFIDGEYDKKCQKIRRQVGKALNLNYQKQ